MRPLNYLFLRLKGGTGSGNFGHSGRPGKHGGSETTPGIPAHLSKVYAEAPKNDEGAFNKYLFGQAKAGNITIDDAVELGNMYGLGTGPGHDPKPGKQIEVEFDKKTEESLMGLDSVEARWTQGADPEAKRDIKSYYDNFPEAKEARLRMMHQTVSPDKSFEEFLDTPVAAYRGGKPIYEDTFANFTLSKGTAESFAKQHGTGLYEINIKPRDILGYAPTGASEVFIEEELPSGRLARANRIG